MVESCSSEFIWLKFPARSLWQRQKERQYGHFRGAKILSKDKVIGILLKLENSSLPVKTAIIQYHVCNFLHGFQILTSNFLHIFYHWYSISNKYSGENM